MLEMELKELHKHCCSQLYERITAAEGRLIACQSELRSQYSGERRLMIDEALKVYKDLLAIKSLYL